MNLETYEFSMSDIRQDKLSSAIDDIQPKVDEIHNMGKEIERDLYIAVKRIRKQHWRNAKRRRR